MSSHLRQPACSVTALANKKSGLRLEVKALAFKGGDNEGPDIVAGKAQQSPLVQRVRSTDKHQRMPPEGPGLSPKEIALLERWIDQGGSVARRHRPREASRPRPTTGHSSLFTSRQIFTRSIIRRPTLARSRPGTRAGCQTVAWLRRVSYDLIGLTLPPRPKKLTIFSSS